MKLIKLFLMIYGLLLLLGFLLMIGTCQHITAIELRMSDNEAVMSTLVDNKIYVK